ncbi:MAG: MarR family winged helix-turn-helix transcriptional regulator [Candidatus Levyibacteriota bacterium]
METKIDKLISLSMQISKFVTHQTNITFEERAATVLQFHTLSFLEKTPQAKLGEVAKHLNASLSSTTQLLERMHKSGFISRIGDTTDRRVIHHVLTQEGKQKLVHMREAKRNRMKKLLAKIDSHDVGELIRIQEKILKSLADQQNI